MWQINSFNYRKLLLFCYTIIKLCDNLHSSWNQTLVISQRAPLSLPSFKATPHVRWGFLLRSCSCPLSDITIKQTLPISRRIQWTSFSILRQKKKKKDMNIAASLNLMSVVGVTHSLYFHSSSLNTNEKVSWSHQHVQKQVHPQWQQVRNFLFIPMNKNLIRSQLCSA